MFEDFFKNASSLGLNVLKEKYLPSDKKDANETQKQQKQYEQIIQRTAPAPVASPINTQYLMYGGGAFALVVLILLVKGK